MHREVKKQRDLTPREIEVLKWIQQGKTNQEIATILAIATGTVNKHVEQILKKLGVENRTAAAFVFSELHKGVQRPNPKREKH